MALTIRLLIGFLVVLGSVLAFLIYQFVGLDLAKLSLDSERKKLPAVVVRLDSLAKDVDEKDYLRDFLLPREAMIIQDIGSRVFLGRLGVLADGSMSSQDTLVSIHWVPQGEQVVQVVTSPEYIVLENGVLPMSTKRLELLGAVEGKVELGEHLIMVLASVRSTAVESVGQVFEETLQSHAGQLKYQSTTIQLSAFAHEKLNYVAILQFESKPNVNDWLLDVNRKSRFVLHAPQIESLMMFSLRWTRDT